MKDKELGKDFENMMIESIQNKVPFYGWQSYGGILEKCELNVKAFRKDHGEIELEVTPGFENDLGKIISGNRVLNIYVPELSISFVAELKNVGLNGKIKIYLPKSYSFYDRRKQERVRLAKTCYVSFEFNKLMLKKSIYDLSMGGVAIILPKSDKIAIEKGRVFPNFLLEIYGQKIKIKVECVGGVAINRFKLDSLPYGGYKIAFRFVSLEKKEREIITSFILEQVLIEKAAQKAN